MGKTIETVATINSAVRTVLALVVVGGLSAGGYYAWDTYHAKENAQQELKARELELTKVREDLVAREAKIAEQQAEIKQKDEQIEKLEIARRLLKVDHRLAQINILDQTTENGEITNTVQFIELNPEGHSMGPPRVFKVKGDMLYIDGLSVTFRDEFVEQADLERGTSLFSFTRIFTDIQNPKDGPSLDDVNTRPLAYGKGPMSDFEKNIWDNFWNIANDTEKAGELGIANIHGSAVSIKPVKGHSYTIELRASAGPKLKHEGKIPMEGN